MINTRAIAVFCASLLVAQQPYAFAQQPQSPTPTGTQSQATLTPGQLDSLVAPIALYPDPILSQMLVASTYPLEIVEAGRWVKQNPSLQGKALTEAAAKQPWDASVQALVGLPQALTKLDQDVGWTSDLGNAFLAQQADVMDAIQRMRHRAADAGALQSTPQQTVSTTTANDQSVIEIQPASPQVVYVPTYNPEAVWGPPPDYYPYPALYYPPVSTGAAIAAGAISFGAGIAIGAIWAGGGGWNNWGWNAGWGHNNVVINNNFINNNRFNRVNVANGNNWVHNPAHRDGVPYNNRAVANRYQGGGNLPSGRPTAGQVQQGLSQAGRGAAGFAGQGNVGRGAGQAPGQGANRMAPGNVGPGAGNRGGVPGNIAPGAGNRGGVPANIGQGGANRMAPGAMGGDANRIGNRTMPSASSAAGAFGGMRQGGNQVRMDSNRGAASRGFGGGGFGGGGFRGGGGGFRGGGGRRR
jgi:Protein of unknown function (DUF3300)